MAEIEAAQIPDRLFFRIGDVSELSGVEPYVLRFWENEITALSPKKGSNGQRQYRRKDVETVLEIKRLLYDEGYTIAGARKALRERSRKQRRKAPTKRKQKALFEPLEKSDPAALKEIKRELKEILALLK